MKMLDYHMHFALLLTEDHLRNADRRRSQARPRGGQARVVRVVKDQAASREQDGRR